MIRESSIVVADANVPADALQRVVEIANEAGVPLILDPVSVAKAQRVAGLVAAMHNRLEMPEALQVAAASAAVVVGAHTSTLTATGSAEIRKQLRGE